MNKKQENGLGGLILIAIGLLALMGQFVDFTNWNGGLWIVPGLAIIFLVWGILTHNPGLIIPGGILGGIGAGTLLIAGPWASRFTGDAEGGIFMLAFAAGWLSIVGLTAVFTPKAHYWPLIPGGIMAAIGSAILFGGVFMAALAFLGKIWPAFLILAGLYIIFTARSREKVAG